MDNLITVKQARRSLKKKSIQRVYDLVRRGHIPPGVVVRVGGRIFFHQKNLTAWIKAGGNAAPQKEESARSK